MVDHFTNEGSLCQYALLSCNTHYD